MNSCIYELEEIVIKHPEKLAVYDAVNRYTFAQLRDYSQKIATLIKPDLKNHPIAVFIPKSSNAIASFMGVLYSDNFYVPLDVKSPVERLNKILKTLNPTIILTDDANYQKIKNLNVSSDIVNISKVFDAEFQNTYDIQNLKSIITDPIYCIYTSGSTGDPKGVLVSHLSVKNFIDWIVDTYKLNTETLIGSQSPFIFDVSVIDIYTMIRVGATICLIPDSYFSFPYKLMSFVDNEKINFIIWVPSVIANVANTASLNGRNLTHLKKVLFAGEVLSAKSLNYWINAVPNALFSNLYGPTEATVIAGYYIVDRKFSDNDIIPLGSAASYGELLILNNENDLIETADEIGELCIKGISLALGYWNNFEKTDEVFIQNPVNNEFPEKIYKTGDLVKYNNLGEILYIGRKDRQIKHMGYRIELGEIENAIISIPKLHQACVLYDDTRSDIILFYCAKSEEINDRYILSIIKNKIPKYMFPTRYKKLDDMPLNSNGKIDRLELKKRL